MRLLGALLVSFAVGNLTIAGPIAAAQTSYAEGQVSPQTLHVLSATWSVQLDQTTVTSRLGDKFRFTSTIRNQSSSQQPGTIAYLNIVSMDPQVYVDPEDWSSQRTRYLGSVAGRDTVPVEWKVQAVNSGRFVVFVVVTSERGSAEVVTSKALRVEITNQRSLNPTGIVPVVLGVPGIAAVALVLTRRRRRRLR